MSRHLAADARTLVPQRALPHERPHRDELTRLALEGNPHALRLVARELRFALVCEARSHLPGREHESEDVVQDVFIAILEGRIRAPPGPGETMARLRRLVGVFARRRA